MLESALIQLVISFIMSSYKCFITAIDFRSSCPLRSDVEEIPDHTTGCSCSWLDQHGTTPEKLCKCGIVVDDDCFLTACNTSLDIYSSQNDGPCEFETVTVDSVAHKYTVCKDGLKTDLNGTRKIPCLIFPLEQTFFSDRYK